MQSGGGNGAVAGDTAAAAPANASNSDLLQRIETAIYVSLLLVPVGVGIYAGFHLKPVAARPADFAIYRTAAEMVSSGSGARLYDVASQQAFFQRVTADLATLYDDQGRAYESFLIWSHHPVEALLYLPSVLLSYQGGLLAMQAVNVVLICGFAAYSLHKIRYQHGRILILFVVLMAAIPFFAASITMGQDSLWVMILVFLGLLLLLEDRPTKAGVLIGLASVKYTIIFPLLGILFVAGNRRAAGVAAAVSAGLVVLPAAVLGFGMLADYGQLCMDLAGTDGKWGLHSELLWNFRGLVQDELNPPTTLAVGALGGLGYAVAMRRVPKHLLPGLALFGAAFFSPHVYRHDGVMFIGGLTLVLIGLSRKQDAMAARIAAQ